MIDLNEVLSIHQIVMGKFGGNSNVRDLNALKSAINRPFATFDNNDLYPTPIDKAAALVESIVINHPFVDGNKRIGLMVSHVFLLTNGYALEFTSQQAEMITMRLASSEMDRRELTTLIEGFIIPLRDQNHN